MDYSTHSDGELLLIFKSGDVRAFDALFNRHWKPLYCLAKKILEDEDLAKDTLQEAFVALYENAVRHQVVNVKSWLFQAVKYQCFMHLRSGKISQAHLECVQIASGIEALASNTIPDIFYAAFCITTSDSVQ